MAYFTLLRCSSSPVIGNHILLRTIIIVVVYYCMVVIVIIYIVIITHPVWLIISTVWAIEHNANICMWPAVVTVPGTINIMPVIRVNETRIVGEAVETVIMDM